MSLSTEVQMLLNANIDFFSPLNHRKSVIIVEESEVHVCLCIPLYPDIGTESVVNSTFLFFFFFHNVFTNKKYFVVVSPNLVIITN